MKEAERMKFTKELLLDGCKEGYMDLVGHLIFANGKTYKIEFEDMLYIYAERVS